MEAKKSTDAKKGISQPASIPTATTKTALFLSVNDSTAFGIMTEDLKIESALLIICGGIEKGNGDQMYYRNTLKDSGKQFSESAQWLVNTPWYPYCKELRLPPVEYRWMQPFEASLKLHESAMMLRMGLGAS
ncbi:FK506-binding protein [Fusarium circinatum]|uniref:FK506-binding protein n=1 Tax=Fusarium circinatum TaxID=48490 RepID=A0A8H5X9K5_FUSCI|nr:FK506-binding protein [Fusarium circinatum]